MAETRSIAGRWGEDAPGSADSSRLSRDREVVLAELAEQGEREVLAALRCAPFGRRALHELAGEIERPGDAARALGEELLAILEGRAPGRELPDRWARAALPDRVRRVLLRGLRGLAPERRWSLVAAIRDGLRKSREARGELVEATLWLARALARRHRGRAVPVADLVQEGTLGLLRAAERFDPRFETRFHTYALYWVQHAISRAIVQLGHPLRLPLHADASLARLVAARARLTQELGREPALEEIAAGAELPASIAMELFLATRPPRSLQASVGSAEDVVVEDLLTDESVVSAPDRMDAARIRHAVREALGSLSAREQWVLAWRFGVDGRDERTLQAVGDELGLSRERVRQIEAQALDRLRRLPSIRELEELARSA